MATTFNDMVTELPDGWRWANAGETEWFTQNGWHGVIGVQTGPEDQVDYAVVEDFSCPWSDSDLEMECPTCEAAPGVPCDH